VGNSWFLFRLAAAVIIELNETIEQNDVSVARFEIPTAVLLKINPSGPGTGHLNSSTSFMENVNILRTKKKVTL